MISQVLRQAAKAVPSAVGRVGPAFSNTLEKSAAVKARFSETPQHQTETEHSHKYDVIRSEHKYTAISSAPPKKMISEFPKASLTTLLDESITDSEINAFCEKNIPTKKRAIPLKEATINEEANSADLSTQLKKAKGNESTEETSETINNPIKERLYNVVASVIGLIITNLLFVSDDADPTQLHDVCNNAKNEALKELDKVVVDIDKADKKLDDIFTKDSKKFRNNPELSQAEKNQLIQGLKDKNTEEKKALLDDKNRVMQAIDDIKNLQIDETIVQINETSRTYGIAIVSKLMFVNPILSIALTMVLDVATNPNISKEKAENICKKFLNELNQLEKNAKTITTEPDITIIQNLVRLGVNECIAEHVSQDAVSINKLFPRLNALLPQGVLNQLIRGVNLSIPGILIGGVLGSVNPRHASTEQLTDIIDSFKQNNKSHETINDISKKVEKLVTDREIYSDKLASPLSLQEKTNKEVESPQTPFMGKITGTISYLYHKIF